MHGKSLTIQRAQDMLYNRMLQYIAMPISEEPPHAIRAPDKGVVDLARAYLPFVEMGHVGFIKSSVITAPSVCLTVESLRLLVR